MGPGSRARRPLIEFRTPFAQATNRASVITDACRLACKYALSDHHPLTLGSGIYFDAWGMFNCHLVLGTAIGRHLEGYDGLSGEETAISLMEVLATDLGELVISFSMAGLDIRWLLAQERGHWHCHCSCRCSECRHNRGSFLPPTTAEEPRKPHPDADSMNHLISSWGCQNCHFEVSPECTGCHLIRITNWREVVQGPE